MQVSELKSGDLFTLNCEQNKIVYEFLDDEVNDKDEIVGSKIRTIASWWPENVLGKGQWLTSKPQVQKCNPYADCVKVKIDIKNI